MEFIDLKSQYQHLKENIDAAIQKVLDHGQYILGPEVAEFEAMLSDYVGVKHSIGCANGTDALQLCMMALDIKQGDAVFCPTFTFFASAEVISLVGATPKFVDSDPDTFNVCAKDLEKQIIKVIEEGDLTPKAIISVDLFGLPADYAAVRAVADKYGLKIIEDAAQGLGGSIDDKKAGCFGDLATTSFFPAKPLGCYGDGGAIFTDDDELADLIKSLRFHGKGSHKYDNIRIGLNSRLDTIQAAILIEKLKEFPTELIARNKLADQYNAEFSTRNDMKTPIVPEGYYSSWAQYTVQSDRRDALMAEFKEKGIPTVIYYPTCMHEQTVFKDLGYQLGDFPVAEKLSREVFSLPMHGYMEKDVKELLNA